MSPTGSPTATDHGIREAVRDARVQAAAAMLAALALLVTNGLVSRSQGWDFPGTPWWTWMVLAVPELALLVLLVVSALGGVGPGRHRDGVLVLLGVLAAAGLSATGLLIWALATADLTAGQLLMNAAVVWSTNLIIFGLIFWELDGGGPLQRVVRGRATPDFQFPQDQNPDLAPAGWLPRLLDYLYVSLTNSLAYSPTDAMPLSRRAKLMMGLEALISTVILVRRASPGSRSAISRGVSWRASSTPWYGAPLASSATPAGCGTGRSSSGRRTPQSRTPASSRPRSATS